MKSIFSLAAAALLLGASTVAARREYPAAAAQWLNIRGGSEYNGCYSSSEGISFNSTDKFNSMGYCSSQCRPIGKAVTAVTNSNACWCGDELPPTSSKVDDSKCSDICPGYGTESCGADGFWTVYYTDDSKTNAPHADSADSTQSSTDPKSSATTSAQPSVVTIGGQTVVVTAPADSTSSKSSKSSGGGPNKAAIAAGVVVGIVAIAAAAGGVFLFLRNRRNRAVEEEYRRNAAVSSFIGGGKPPTSSGGASSFDTRLDPVMAQRRMSDGSIADNQDYSRRILKVTNA